VLHLPDNCSAPALAPHLKQALAGDLSPKQVIEAGLAEFIRKEDR
jgi:hypothetical protein